MVELRFFASKKISSAVRCPWEEERISSIKRLCLVMVPTLLKNNSYFYYIIFLFRCQAVSSKIFCETPLKICFPFPLSDFIRFPSCPTVQLQGNRETQNGDASAAWNKTYIQAGEARAKYFSITNCESNHTRKKGASPDFEPSTGYSCTLCTNP